MSRPRNLHAIADRQHGLVLQSQALASGYDRWGIQRLVEHGFFERLSPRVLRQSGSPPTLPQEHLAAVLDAGGQGAVTCLSAAALWGVPGFQVVRPVQVARVSDRRGRQSKLGQVRPVRALADHHVTTVDGVPVLSLPITLYRLAGLVKWERFERAADTVCGRSPRILDALHQLLPEMGARGRNGITAMREFLAERPVGYQGAHTNLEARVNQLLREWGEAPLEHQVDLGGHSWLGRVDLYDRPHRFVLEVYGDAYHRSRCASRDDERRQSALEEAGFTVVPVPEEVVWQRPWELVHLVRAHRRG